LRVREASPQKKTFECSPEDLIEVFKYVDNVNFLHKVAFEVFCIDNIQSLNEVLEPTGTIRLSEFTTDATLAYSIFASGFRILKAARKGFRWALVLHDLHDRNKGDIQMALQEALIPYLLHRGPTEVNAWIESLGDRHFVSFRGEMRSSSEVRETGYILFRIGRNFRIEGSVAEDQGNIERD
jgi:hypothetical protein